MRRCAARIKSLSASIRLSSSRSFSESASTSFSKDSRFFFSSFASIPSDLRRAAYSSIPSPVRKRSTSFCLSSRTACCLPISACSAASFPLQSNISACAASSVSRADLNECENDSLCLFNAATAAVSESTTRLIASKSLMSCLSCESAPRASSPEIVFSLRSSAARASALPADSFRVETTTSSCLTIIVNSSMRRWSSSAFPLVRSLTFLFTASSFSCSTAIAASRAAISFCSDPCLFCESSSVFTTLSNSRSNSVSSSHSSVAFKRLRFSSNPTKRSAFFLSCSSSRK